MVLGTFNLFALSLVGFMLMAVLSGLGVVRWRQIWGMGGALFGCFTLAALAPAIPLQAVRLASVLLVGAGVGVGYASLFWSHPGLPRISRDAGAADRLMALAEHRSALDVRPLDYVVTSAFLAPAVGLIALGMTAASGLLTSCGLVALLPPAFVFRRLSSVRRSAEDLDRRIEVLESELVLPSRVTSDATGDGA